MATIDELDQGLADSRDLLELAEMEEDEGTVEEVRKELDGLQDALEKLEFRRMFSGEMDENNAYLDIQVGLRGHRSSGLGQHSAAHVPALGRKPRLQDRDHRNLCRGSRGHQVGVAA